MSVSRDTSKGTWTVYARYTDWQGKVKVLHKRGFNTKREAVEYSKLLKDISMQLADLLKQVKGIAVNINQLAYKANAYGEIPTEKQIREYGTQTEVLRREADAIWQLIRRSISRQRHTEP